jgi:hypothetical protein
MWSKSQDIIQEDEATDMKPNTLLESPWNLLTLEIEQLYTLIAVQPMVNKGFLTFFTSTIL